MLALCLNGGGVCKVGHEGGGAAAACKMIRLINHVAHTDAGNTTLGIEKTWPIIIFTTTCVSDSQ